MNKEQQRDKFKESEILLGLIFTLLIDIGAGLLDVPVIGIIIGWLIQTGTTLIIGWWFKRKGDPNGLKMGKTILKAVLNIMPSWFYVIGTFTTSIAFLIEVFLHNHPGILGKTGAFIQSKLGGKILNKIGMAK